MDKTSEEILARYGKYFEDLTPEKLSLLDSFVTKDVHFQDPFHDLRGLESFRRIFEDMYRSTNNPRFFMLGQAANPSGGFLYWSFEFSFRSRWIKSPQRFTGVSLVQLNEAGLVSEHLDFWDAASNVYEKLPMVGALVRQLKRGIQR